jgi:hypothetical protein
MFVSCAVFVLSGRVSATGRSLVQRIPTDYGVCDQVKLKNLEIYCEQVDRRGKDCETNSSSNNNNNNNNNNNEHVC